jgi:hypothetical protein
MYFCLIRCRFEVWKKKTNLVFFSSMVFFSFFCSLFCFLFFVIYFLNFLLRLFYCISLFCFMFKYIYFICFHFVFIFKCFKKILIVKVFFCFYLISRLFGMRNLDASLKFGERRHTPHSFSSKVFLHYYKFYFFVIFYSLFGFFFFVIFI